MAVPNTFAASTTTIPLANLDANFAYYDAAYSIAATTMTVNYTLSATGAVALNPANLNVVISPTGTGLVTINPATAGTINKMSIGATTPAAGAFTTLGASGAVTLSPASANVVLSPTGTGLVTINPATAGTINRMSIGATVAATGAFTSVTTSSDIFMTGGGEIYFTQPAPTALTATATLTIAQLLTQIITGTAATALIFTLPTGTLVDGGVPASVAANMGFDWSVINLGSALGAITMTGGVGNTYVGNATIAINTSARFRTTKTAAATYITYRVA
jgi:hypothetical protein